MIIRQKWKPEDRKQMSENRRQNKRVGSFGDGRLEFTSPLRERAQGEGEFK
jgi:hypothetical protein